GRALWAAHQDVWNAGVAVGRMDEARRHLAAACRLAEEQGDHRRIFWSSMERVIEAFLDARWDAVLDGVARTLAGLPSSSDQHGSTGRALRAFILLAQDDVEQAASDAALSVAAARVSSYSQQLGPSLGASAATLAALGRLDEARAAALEAVAGDHFA